jgi:hypothetical protein
MVSEETFDQWAIVEMLGHRRVAGRVREVVLAGAGMLRVDVPTTPGHVERTMYVSPGSVYALHPTSEAVAVAARSTPDPVSRWELPSATGQPAPGRVISGDDFELDADVDADLANEFDLAEDIELANDFDIAEDDATPIRAGDLA